MPSWIRTTSRFCLVFALPLFLLLALFVGRPATLVAQTATPAPTPGIITATVTVPGLNLRAGPGTTYARLGGVARNAVLQVKGQIDSCSWLRVTTAAGVEAWVSGDARFIALDGDCDVVPVAEPDALPAPVRATSTPRAAVTASAAATSPITATSSSTISKSTSQPSAQPTSTATPALTAESTPAPATATQPEQEPAANSNGADFPEGQGCVRVGNYIGPELTVTFTLLSSGSSFQSKVENNTARIFCLDPGRYSVTADAPPPWSNINFEIDVKVGEGIDIPLVPQ